jgi:hypothetical protein
MATKIPDELLSRYTMDGQIPVREYLLFAGSSPGMAISEPFTEQLIRNSAKGSLVPDGAYGVRDVLHDVLDAFPCEGKSVAVVGTQVPWMEGALLSRGAAAITTVEYNPLHIAPDVTAKHNWACVHYDDFMASTGTYDLIGTFSSVEHDGLGRYGDPLNPEGDFLAMQHVHRKLSADGRVLWGAPVGLDALCWTAHRVYGRIRLPRLLSGFRAVAYFGPDTYTTPHSTLGVFFQPWIVLEKCGEPDGSDFDAVHASLLHVLRSR